MPKPNRIGNALPPVSGRPSPDSPGGAPPSGGVLPGGAEVGGPLVGGCEVGGAEVGGELVVGGGLVGGGLVGGPLVGGGEVGGGLVGGWLVGGVPGQVCDRLNVPWGVAESVVPVPAVRVAPIGVLTNACESSGGPKSPGPRSNTSAPLLNSRCRLVKFTFAGAMKCQPS